MPLLLSFVGRSDTGKTRLILKLIPEFFRRGFRTAVVKDCCRGFDLDREGKDSYHFTQAGAQAVMLTSPDQIGLIMKKDGDVNLKARLEKYFDDFDLILIEGLREEPEIEKIELLRKGVNEIKEANPEETIAYVCDYRLNTEKPVFDPDDVEKIVRFIEHRMNHSSNRSRGRDDNP
ncbi:MAG: molybdopterin-guanine dinucleotide biosynthesis protein B [bacterium]